MRPLSRAAPYLQATPLALIFAAFFLLPLLVTFVVSFWSYTGYSIQPDFIADNYRSAFDGCLARLPDLCTTFRTYLSTLRFCLIVWAATLLIGFTVAYYLVFQIRSPTVRLALALLTTTRSGPRTSSG